MNYQCFIASILIARGRHGLSNDVYKEVHHITPKCNGGTNDPKNMVSLTAQEHYIAHKLLAAEYPDHNGIQLAWWNMCQCTQQGMRKYNISAEEYAEARERCAKIGREIWLGEKNPMYGKHLTDEQKKQIADSMIGEKNHFYGKHHTEEAKAKISEANSGENHPLYGKHIPEETKRKMSEAQIGEKNHAYGQCGELSSRYGSKHSDESKNKISQVNKGKNLGNQNAKGTRVLCVETGEIFETMSAAGKNVSTNPRAFSNISICCVKTYRTAYGYHWRYVEEEDNG